MQDMLFLLLLLIGALLAYCSVAFGVFSFSGSEVTPVGLAASGSVTKVLIALSTMAF